MEKIMEMIPTNLILSYAFSLIVNQMLLRVKWQILKLVSEDGVYSPTLTIQQQERDHCDQRKTIQINLQTSLLRQTAIIIYNIYKKQTVEINSVLNNPQQLKCVKNGRLSHIFSLCTELIGNWFKIGLKPLFRMLNLLFYQFRFGF